MSRLPIPGKDIGAWGAILNEYLLTEHGLDGTHKLDIDSTLSADSDLIIASQKAVKTYVDGQVSASIVGNATTTQAGKVRLAGDLAGDALNPRVKSRTSITVGSGGDYEFSDYPTTTACLQAALDAYTSDGAVITLTESCTLTSTVRLRANITLRARKGVIIHFNSGHTGGAPSISNGGFHAFETDRTISHFRLENLQFDGGLTTLQTGVDGAEYHAIYIRHGSSQFTVADIYATRTASGAVRVRDNCHNFTLQNINVFEADAAIIATVGCHNFSIKNIRAVHTFAEGLYLGSDIYDFTVDDIYTETSGTRGLSINNDATPAIRAGYRGTISNVICKDAVLHGVYLVGCDELTLTNIYTRNNGRDGVLIYKSNNIVFANSQHWNNNRARATDGTSQYSGIRIFDSKRILLTNPVCDDDGAPAHQYRGVDSAQSVAGATDYIKVTDGKSENTVSSSQAVIIGNNSTVHNHTGFNPRRYSDRGNVSASPQILLKNGDTQKITLAQNTAIQALDTNTIPGQKCTLIIAQNATGGWSCSLPPNITLTNGPFQLATAANSISTIMFEFIGAATGWYEIARGDKSRYALDANAQTDAQTPGLIAKRMTTSERDALSNPQPGIIIYNTSSNKFQGFENGGWLNIV